MRGQVVSENTLFWVWKPVDTFLGLGYLCLNTYKQTFWDFFKTPINRIKKRLCDVFKTSFVHSYRTKWRSDVF